jgi:hypothetical protein
MSERFENDRQSNDSHSDASHWLLASALEPHGGNPIEPPGGGGGSNDNSNSNRNDNSNRNNNNNHNDSNSNSRSSSDSNSSSHVGDVRSNSSSQGGDAKSNATGGDARSNAAGGAGGSSDVQTSNNNNSSANGGDGGSGGTSDVNVNNQTTNTSRDFYMEATQAPTVLPGAPPATSFEYTPGNGSRFSANSNGSIDTTSIGVNIGAPGVGGFGFGYGESRANNMEAVVKTSGQQQTSFDMFISNVADPRLGLPRLEIQQGALAEVRNGQIDRAHERDAMKNQEQ